MNAMNPTALAVLTRSAGAAAQDIFRRIYPGTPTTEQFKAAQIAMAEAALPAIRKFGEESSKAPQNTEAHYAVAVLAIVNAGVRATMYAKGGGQEPVAAPASTPSTQTAQSSGGKRVA
jgi:hypothetical protein